MPGRRNRGLPSQKIADEFAIAARANRELRRKVFSELSERTNLSAGLPLTVVGAVAAPLNALVVVAAEAVPPVVAFAVPIVSLVALAVVGLATLGNIATSRRAGTWLAAYEEACGSDFQPLSVAVWQVHQ